MYLIIIFNFKYILNIILYKFYYELRISFYFTYVILYRDFTKRQEGHWLLLEYISNLSPFIVYDLTLAKNSSHSYLMDCNFEFRTFNFEKKNC
jgi:hypothetical protein